MGIFYRAVIKVLGWVWRRTGDTSTAVWVLDFMDAKTAALAIVGGIGSMIIAATNYGWSVQTVFFAALIGAACVSVIAVAVRALLSWSGNAAATSAATPSVQDDLLADLPDLRVADSPFALSLFEHPKCDEIYPLLEAEKIIAWGRPMGGGSPPLAKIPGTIWSKHDFFFFPADRPGLQNQTFVKTKGSGNTAFYDVHLNSAQVDAIWPDNASELAWNFERHPEKVVFIGLSAGPEDQILVHNFQARGRNNSRDPIMRVDGYVRSDRTGSKHPLLFNIAGKFYAGSAIAPIPVGATIDAAASFFEGDKPIGVRKFLTEYVPFTFFFEYDRKIYRQTFTLQQVEARIREYEQTIRKNLTSYPQMTRKSG